MDTADRPQAPAVQLPFKIDLERAFGAYVGGRQAGVTPELVAFEETITPLPAAPGGSGTILDPGSPSFGVGVPDRLVYHRGAGTWRDRLQQSGRFPIR